MSDKFNNKYRIQSARLQNWNYQWNAAYFITICTKNRENYFGKISGGKIQLSPIGAIADVLWHEIKYHAKNIELDAFIVMPNHIHGILILAGNENDDEFGNKYQQNDNNNENDNNNGMMVTKDNIGNGIDNGLITNDNIGNDNDMGMVNDDNMVIGGDMGIGGDIGIGDGIGVVGIVETGHALSLQHHHQQHQQHHQQPIQQPIQQSIQQSNEQPTEQSLKTIGQQRFQNIGKNSVSSIIGSYKSAVSKHAHRLKFEFEWQTLFHDHVIRNNDEFHRIQQYIINNPLNWQEDKFYE